jgi:hypothetical protein
MEEYEYHRQLADQSQSLQPLTQCGKAGREHGEHGEEGYPVNQDGEMKRYRRGAWRFVLIARTRGSGTVLGWVGGCAGVAFS